MKHTEIVCLIRGERNYIRAELIELQKNFPLKMFNAGLYIALVDRYLRHGDSTSYERSKHKEASEAQCFGSGLDPDYTGGIGSGSRQAKIIPQKE
jgi:hypothetical protein